VADFYFGGDLHELLKRTSAMT